MNSRKILVVEDEMKIAEIVKAYLEKEEFRVTIAERGEKALSLLKEGFALIILDLMLPDMAGEDICRAIRKGDYLDLFPNARYFIIGMGTNDLGTWTDTESTSRRIIGNLDWMVQAVVERGSSGRSCSTCRK